MNELRMSEPSWQVYTTDRIYGGYHRSPSANWAWVAYGPRGSQSGVENSAEDAVQKAYAATVLLADPQRQTRETRAAI